MKFKGLPNEAVFALLRSYRNGKPKRTYLFSFDENGEHEIDTSSISESLLLRIKAKYEVIAEEVDLSKLKRKELFAMAREAEVEVAVTMSNKDLIKAIKEVS